MNTPRFFFRQCLRVVLWGGGVLAVLYALTAWILNWTGDRRWERVKAELEAVGGSLDYLELLPPPIPDEQNFAAIEPLNGIRTPPGESEAARAAQAKRDVIERATEFVIRSQAKAGVLRNSGCFTAARGVNMGELVRVYHEGGFLEWPDDAPVDACGLQIAIEKHAPFILHLGQEAAAKANAEFLPGWTRETMPENLMAISVPHYNLANRIAQLLRVHGDAALLAGDNEGATLDILINLRLSSALYRECSWISYLVGMVNQVTAHQLVWHALQHGQFEENQIARVQDALTSMELGEHLLRCSLGDVVVIHSALDHMEDTSEPGILGFPNAIRPVLGLLWPGALKHIKSKILEDKIVWIITPLQKGGIHKVLRQNAELKTWLKDQRTVKIRMDRLISRLAIQPFHSISLKSAHAENTRRQAVLACALERHRLRHQAYPVTLADLQIEVPALCLEGVDGKPMRYRLSEDGRYRLWSDGLDGKDDGGAFHVELHPGEKSPQPDNERYQGDWVWRYDAVK